MHRLFVRIENGVLYRIDKMDESYVHFTVMQSPLSSNWAMPRAEYEETFVELFRPASAAEALGVAEGIQMPANAPPEWSAKPVDGLTPDQ